MQVPSSRPNTPMQRMYPDRIRLNTPYPEMANYMYQTPYGNPMMYGYGPQAPPPMANYFNIPPAEMADGVMDFNPYSSGFSAPVPYAYPIYYNMPSMSYRRPPFNPTFRSPDFEESSEKRMGPKKTGKKPKSYDSTPNDINPDSLKNMLYDTLQQEMSALEVLKQQIASFTLLTHSLEHNDRSGRSTTTEVTAPGLGNGHSPQISPPIKNNGLRMPQFDSTQQQALNGVYALPAQNMKSPLVSTNFVNPAPYYQYPETQQAHLVQYDPYSSTYPSNNYMAMTPPPPPQRADHHRQSSFVTMNHSGSTSTNAGNTPTNIYTPLPSDGYTNYQQSQALPIYASDVRRYPPSLLNGRMAADSYPDSFHDLAIKTLYDVEEKLREAEEKISEKISEFETEVSGTHPPANSLGYSHPAPYYQSYDYPNRRSMEREKTESDMNPSMVKELAVRALKAIDRRLRAAEKTIDKTIYNFDGMGADRAVKSITRDIGVQTPLREVVYDSDTDDSNRNRSSDS